MKPGWKDAAGGEVCTHCCQPLLAGMRLYVGPLTGATYDAACAGRLFQVFPKVSSIADSPALAKHAPDFVKAMAALKARAGMKVTKTVVIGGEE